MDLNCLIKLLLEKNIIEYAQDNCIIDEKIIMSAFKFEYEEVFEKIVESRYDKTKICVTRAHYDKNIFCVLNIPNFEEGLVYIGENKESFGFRKSRYGMRLFPYRKLIEIITEDTRFYTNGDYDINESFLQIIDGDLESKRLEDEFNRRCEVIDFLDQLP